MYDRAIFRKKLNYKIEKLLSENEIKFSNYTLNSLKNGGNNNKIYELKVTSGENDKFYIIKNYFNEVKINQGRMEAEISFIKLMEENKIKNIPRLLAIDKTNKLALYEKINGVKLNNKDIDIDDVIQAAVFFNKLNSIEIRKKATNIRIASDGCMSITDHIVGVEKRVARLNTIQLKDKPEKLSEIIDLIINSWNKVKKNINEFDIKAKIEPISYCLTPSDFGFHNAIKISNGTIKFLDFEYAGWDDPAKTVADFFKHPGVRVPERFLSPFIEIALQNFNDKEYIKMRVKMLENLTTLRWCCIVLNEFMPDISKRRSFANLNYNDKESKLQQLAKASSLISELKL